MVWSSDFHRRIISTRMSVCVLCALLKSWDVWETCGWHLLEIVSGVNSSPDHISCKSFLLCLLCCVHRFVRLAGPSFFVTPITSTGLVAPVTFTASFDTERNWNGFQVVVLFWNYGESILICFVNKIQLHCLVKSIVKIRSSLVCQHKKIVCLKSWRAFRIKELQGCTNV